MPNVGIREKFQDINHLRDITWYYRKLGKCVYQGYVAQETVTGWNQQSLEPYAYYSEYWSKGCLRRRKSLNFPYTVGRYLVNNMYAEYPEITLVKEKDEVDKQVNLLDQETEKLRDVLLDSQFQTREKDNFEVSFHIGDRIIKPYVQNSKVKLQYIAGDLFYATRIENNEIISGIFPTFKVVNEGKRVIHYTRVEWHYEVEEELTDEELIARDAANKPKLVGRVIKIEIYKGNYEGHLKQRCDYNTHYHIFGKKINEREYFEGLEQPTFVFIKNPYQNNKDLNDGRGIGGIVNTLDTIISVDEAFNSKSTDNVYGSMKVMIPDNVTDTVVDDDGKEHKHYNPTDPENWVYNSNTIDSSPEAFAPTLRTTSFIESINTDLDISSVNIGISAGTFRFDGKSIITATQVITEKSDTARTIKEYENSNGDGWCRLFMLIKYFANKYTADNFTFEKEDINIQWFDNIAVDDEKRLEDMKQDSEDGYLPKWRYNMEKYNLTEKDAKRWVIESQAEHNELFDTLDVEDNEEEDEDEEEMVEEE